MKISRDQLFDIPEWQEWDDMSESSKFHNVMKVVNKYYEAPKEGETSEQGAEKILQRALQDKVISIKDEKKKRLGLIEWLSDEQRTYIKDRLIPDLEKVHKFSTRFKNYDGLVDKDDIIYVLNRILDHDGYTEREQLLLRKMARLHRSNKTPFRKP